MRLASDSDSASASDSDALVLIKFDIESGRDGDELHAGRAETLRLAESVRLTGQVI